MRKLVAVLLMMALLLGAVSTAFAKSPYMLDIYWIGNEDNEEIRTGV